MAGPGRASRTHKAGLAHVVFQSVLRPAFPNIIAIINSALEFLANNTRQFLHGNFYCLRTTCGVLLQLFHCARRLVVVLLARDASSAPGAFGPSSVHQQACQNLRKLRGSENRAVCDGAEVENR